MWHLIFALFGWRQVLEANNGDVSRTAEMFLPNCTAEYQEQTQRPERQPARVCTPVCLYMRVSGACLLHHGDVGFGDEAQG